MFCWQRLPHYTQCAHYFQSFSREMHFCWGRIHCTQHIHCFFLRVS